MAASHDGNVTLPVLAAKVREIGTTLADLQSDCQDNRRLAYDADLRLRTHVSHVEQSFRDALRKEGAQLRKSLGSLGKELADEQARRTRQLEELAGELGELVQADLRENGERVRSELTRHAQANAERVEALEVRTELRETLHAATLQQIETKMTQQAEQLTKDSGVLLDALTRNNEQHARATELLRRHWERRENILAAIEAQSEALTSLGQQHQDAMERQVEAGRATEDLRSEITQVRASIVDQRNEWTEEQGVLRRDARAESARLERRCEGVAKETRLMQVSVIQQLDRKLEMLVEPLQKESKALRNDLQTTLDERLRAGEEALAALKEHTERSVEDRLRRSEGELTGLSSSVDERLGELSNSLEGRLSINEAKLLAVADESSAAIDRLGSQLAVEVEALRADSDWGLALHGETVADEITQTTDKLRSDLEDNVRQLQTRFTESLLAVESSANAQTEQAEILRQTITQTQADQIDRADAMQREIAAVTASCGQTASSLSTLQMQTDKTAAELSQVGEQVVGELQERFDVLEAQIADTVPSLDARIRKTEKELVENIEWMVDAGLAAVEEDLELYRVSNAASLTRLEDITTKLAARLDATGGRDSGASLAAEETSNDGHGPSMSAVVELHDGMAQARAESSKASKRSKQAERSIGTMQERLVSTISSMKSIQNTIVAMRQQNDASAAGMVTRIETIEESIADRGVSQPGLFAQSRDMEQVEKLGRQVAEGLRRAAGAEGQVADLRAELMTMRKLMGKQQQLRPSIGSLAPPVETQGYARRTESVRANSDNRTQGVMKGVAAVVGRRPGPPPLRKTVSGTRDHDSPSDSTTGDSSGDSSDDSDADEI